jgi:hypothetical protein
MGRYLSVLPAALTAVGVLIYGGLTLAYSRFYDDLHISPEDVGLGYATTLTHSIGIVVILAGIIIFLVVYLFIATANRRAGLRARDEERRVYEEVYALQLASRRERDVAKDPAEAAEEARERRSALDRDRIEQEWRSRRIVARVSAITFLIIFLLGIGLFLAIPPLAGHRSNRVAHGDVVGPFRVLGITLFDMTATPAKLYWIQPPPAGTTMNPELACLPLHRLLYLGQNSSTASLYDVTVHKTVRVPLSLVAIRLG